MTVEKLELKSNPGATLTAYLLDTSKEMPNMTERPAVLVIPGGGYYMCSDREAEPIAMAFACTDTIPLSCAIPWARVRSSKCPLPTQRRRWRSYAKRRRSGTLQPIR